PGGNAVGALVVYVAERSRRPVALRGWAAVSVRSGAPDLRERLPRRRDGGAGCDRSGTPRRIVSAVAGLVAARDDAAVPRRRSSAHPRGAGSPAVSGWPALDRRGGWGSWRPHGGL